MMAVFQCNSGTSIAHSTTPTHIPPHKHLKPKKPKTPLKRILSNKTTNKKGTIQYAIKNPENPLEKSSSQIYREQTYIQQMFYLHHHKQSFELNGYHLYRTRQRTHEKPRNHKVRSRRSHSATLLHSSISAGQVYSSKKAR
jgi:hypothetical protein